ncbi:hypothetical protein O2N63_16110 [Aliiroseovarius sp. KMU-50]|uniref:Lipoprotein n=1 Tax=Aliiroseovarius salicola TaxID=3009082 RepID=A0ABT4W570_9RHOB|nr:hypothetical protein [Aliiroseovarius sp. KMU-50]MDA5095615.1 hypothetical protein [Aliiroseovarius sp. KMU-50]
MKLWMVTAGMSLLVLSACMSGSEMSEGAMEEPTATSVLIGKRIVTGDNYFSFNEDGTMGGMMRGEAVSGSYTATANEICSTYTAPEMLTGREYCSTPVYSGDTVVFNRRDGTTSPVYTIEG